MRTGVLACVGSVLCVSGVAMGQRETYTGAGGPINDVSDTRFSIFVDHHAVHNIVRFSLDISHTWAGDLYIEVRHKTPADYACILLDRPGVPQSTFGNSDDLDGVYTFRDGFAPIPEVAGATGFIAPGTYGPHPGQQIDRPVDNFGEWSLLISDRAGGDVGVLRSWTMELLWIPTPGTVAVFGGALGGALRRRRNA